MASRIGAVITVSQALARARSCESETISEETVLDGTKSVEDMMVLDALIESGLLPLSTEINWQEGDTIGAMLDRYCIT